MSDAQMNEFIAKRLALGMALMCVRNTCMRNFLGANEVRQNPSKTEPHRFDKFRRSL